MGSIGDSRRAGVLCLALALASLGLFEVSASAQTRPATIVAATLPACSAAAVSGTVTSTVAREGPQFRRAAQRGLDYVSREAVVWQRSNGCYGCHVQAVTLDALMVGRSHQYDVSTPDFDALVQGMTTIRGGSRNDRDRLFATAQAFSGATFARYDAVVGPALRDDLASMGQRLVSHQQPNGSVRADDVRFPVEAGVMQGTTQAVQTWRQLYERSADERWLLPIRRAEEYLQSQARRSATGEVQTVVDLNYAVMGLAAAGSSPQEQVSRRLDGQLRERQNRDGGWGFRPAEPSSAFATGQTLYALRMLGADDADRSIARGMAWLVEHQGPDGSWSHTGSGKAEAMWSVLGLVSLDLLSVTVSGVLPGQHVTGALPLTLAARDNGNQAIRQIDVRLDDVALHRGCGPSTTWTLDAARLSRGMHVLDVAATNAAGRSSHRRIELYAGDHYLAEMGTRFEDGATVLAWRDLATASTPHRVSVTLFSAHDDHGRSVRDAEIRRQDLPGAQGPMTFRWDGRDTRGTAMTRGRYVAEIRWLDASGRAVHTEELPFVHDTPDAQRAGYGEVAGRVAVAAGGSAPNAAVVLVNEQGRVVQRATTTREGQYRFRNVTGGNYSVRVEREGFAGAAAPVRAAPAQTSAADMTLH